MHTSGSLDLNALVGSFHEAKAREAALRERIREEVEQRIKSAYAQIQEAEKMLEESQRILREVFGEISEPVSAPRQAVLEASTWRWFDKEVSGSDTIRTDFANHRSFPFRGSPPASEPDSRNEAEEKSASNYLAMKEQSGSSSIQIGDEDRAGTMSVSLASSLGSLASSAQHDISVLEAGETLSIIKGKLESPLVAVRKESLAALLRAFDQILLNNTM